MQDRTSLPHVAIIGGGPTGLMAADVLLHHGVRVDLYDRMPSLARKFLMAGKSGMNLSHAEDYTLFLSRYGSKADILAPHIDPFNASHIRQWANRLGIDTFIGTSGKIFPTDYKAAPLLRCWLKDLRSRGLTTHVRHDWQGWHEDGHLLFDTPKGPVTVQADAVLLAIGGASWARLGSDGRGFDYLASRNIPLAPLRPSNCGFDVAWSDRMQELAGEPVKTVGLSFGKRTIRGDLMITLNGVEGSSLYALSADLRDALDDHHSVTLHIDLLPDRTLNDVRERLSKPRGKKSLSTFLQQQLNLRGNKLALLRECTSRDDMNDPEKLAALIKDVALPLLRTRPLDEAISTAGGVSFDGLTDDLMVATIPGLFCAGEMLDWEAPTGGYLLTACFATGRSVARGILDFLNVG